MKKILIFIIVIALLIGAFYFFGPFGFKHPTNYTECMNVGGRSNDTEMSIQAICRYNGKNFNVGGILN